MAHELEERNGRIEAAYALEPAWHGLGKVLDFVPDSEQMIEAAGLDWSVSMRRLLVAPSEATDHKHALQLVGEDGGTKRLVSGNGYRATVRDDNNEVLGIVTDGYGLVQNRDAFKFLDSLWQDGVMKYESAMALKGGRIVVVVARMPGYDDIAEGDKCARYVMFQTSHDGSMKLHAIPTSVRVVCMNTLRMAIQNMEGIRHSGDMDAKLKAVHQYISQFDKKFTDFRDDARRLADRKHTPEQAAKYLEALFPPVKEQGKAQTRRENKVSAVRRNSANSRNALPAIKGTWWSLFNSVTELVDHGSEMIFKGKDRDRKENRYINTVTGVGADFKGKAFKLALDMAGVKS